MFDDILEIMEKVEDWLDEAQATDPLNVQIPKEKLNTNELISAIRQSIIAEQDAIILYETYINSTDDERFKKVFEHIVEDEKHHLGEFQQLLEELAGPEEKELKDKGREEAEEEMREE